MEEIANLNSHFVHTHVKESLTKIQESLQDNQDGAVSSDSSAALEDPTGHTEYFKSYQSYTGSNSDSNLSYLKFDCQCNMCQNPLYLQESISKSGIDLQTSAVCSDSESARGTETVSLHSV